jgi:twitching motility protein PilT
MIQPDATLQEILKEAVGKGASDVHFGAGIRAVMRVDGELEILCDKPFSEADVTRLILQHLPQERFEDFTKKKEMDYSFGISGLGRFRVNLFYQRSNIGCAIRALPFDPRSFEKIGFPLSVAESILSRPSGLVLVCGATGSGKTTTLAAMIDSINERHQMHIMTIEDPVEFVFKNKKSVINQREVGIDTHTFGDALKHVLRQDPDVILIGEMRDLETIETALTVAETGHLVFATLHTPDAVQSINRIIDVFPSHQQQQVRTQFSFVLQAVVCQQLLPKEGGGLALATEIMIANSAIRSLIRDQKTHQIYSVIQMGQKDGMHTLNMSLAQLVKSGSISRETAASRSADVQELERLLSAR